MAITEKTRILQPVVLTGSGVITRDIPKDTVIKRIQLRLKGSIVVTYASGTPINRADGIFHSLINNISVVANGGRFIKSVQPHIMRMQQFFNTGLASERGSSAAAAEVDFPTATSNFVFGTTGQTTTVQESLCIPFEFIWAKSQAEQSLTWLDTRDLTSCEIRFSQNAYGSLQSAENTAPVVYSASTLTIEVTLVEAVGVMKGAKFMDFRQTTKDVPFTAQVSAQQVDINRGNSLAGLWLWAKDGAGGSTTTASDRLSSNTLVTDLNLKLNGSVDLKASNFKTLRLENQSRYGINTPYVSNVSPTDGIVHMNFVNGSIQDAVPTKQGVDSLALFVSTNLAANTSYTKTAFLTIQTDEICEIAS